MRDIRTFVVILIGVFLAACGGEQGATSVDLPKLGTPSNVGSAPRDPALAIRKRVDIAGLTKWVNVFVGTDSPDAGGYYPGNVNPAAQAPFGMVSFGPDTPGSRSPYGDGSGGYFYRDSSIDFFSLTHLSGPGCRAQGAVALIPGSDTLEYSHDNEVASPGYYKVTTTNGIVSELTATTRTGMARLTFPAQSIPKLTINALKSNGMKDGVEPRLVDISVDTNANAVSGHTVVGAFCGGTWNKPVYFYIAFDAPFDAKATTSEAGIADLAFLARDAMRPMTVHLKAGISSVSVANAKLNLQAENPDWNFDAVREQLDGVWNRRLNSIQLDAAKPSAMSTLAATRQSAMREQVSMFYTALYHTMMGPTVYSDVNGDFRSMRQDDLNAPAGTVPVRSVANVSQYRVSENPTGYKTHYAGFSLWDTYRSLIPLQAWLFPSDTSDMMQSLMVDASQCGALPHWVEGSDDTSPMEGDHAPSVVAGAYLFGARGFDVTAGRKYMLQSAFRGPDGTNEFVEGACNNVPGVDVMRGATNIARSYLDLGYVATDRASGKHSASLTLEMVTADASVAGFLAALPTSAGDANVVAELRQRARNWEHLFNDNIPDGATAFGKKGFVPKDSAGQWRYYGLYSGGFHESTSANYLWTIGHDYTALINRLGGKEAAIARLNDLFGLNQRNPYGGAIPAAATLNSGESGTTLYIGNEPALQSPWAYNWTGTPQLAQRVIPIIMNQTFANDPGGLPGNDDVGATSGWLVWATLGLYPVIPSAPGLAMSTPQFAGMTVWLGDGTKSLRIECDDEALLSNKPYIKSVELNGKGYSGSWLPLAEIAQGGTLKYSLSAAPTDWAAGDALVPPSGPAANYSKSVAMEER